MSEPSKVVAIIAANPALSSLLAMVVAGDCHLKVRQFDSETDLIAYMRIAPVHMLVCDFDREGRPAYEMVEGIRLNNDLISQDVPVIALTRAITMPMRHQAISAGIDEVIIKPMSPRHLLGRIQARLRHRSVVGVLGGYRGPERRNRAPLPKPTPCPPGASRTTSSPSSPTAANPATPGWRGRLSPTTRSFRRRPESMRGNSRQLGAAVISGNGSRPAPGRHRWS